MNIRQVSKEELLPMDLLLEADPSEFLIRRYAESGSVFVAEKAGVPIGAYILLPLSDDKVEIKNVAVAEAERGKGIGKQLIGHAIKQAQQQGFQIVEIGTGNSSIGQLALYQKCGFRIESIDHDFFTRNYPEPIFENGILCRDMIRLNYIL